MYKFLLRHHSLSFRNDRTSTCKSLLKLSSKASNTPRPPKDPPDEGYRPQSVDHQEVEVSDFVRPQAYRQFNGSDEVLGPGAGKTKDYKNAQYFGYHRFSFVELQNQSMELRDERRLNGGIQVNMGEDDEEECLDDRLEAMKEREEEFDKALAAQLKDGEKAKLKDWCLAMEKKQEEMHKAQMSSKDDEKKLKEWCEEIEKKQQERAKKGQKLDNKTEKVQKAIDKRVSEILTDCTDKLKKTGDAIEVGKKNAPTECKKEDKVKTEKPAVKCDEAKVKESVKKADEKLCDQPKEKDKKYEMKGKVEKCDKPKENENKCEKPKGTEEKCAKTKETDVKCEKKEEQKSDKCEKTDKDSKK
ncbi:golgin subfamily A member 6-like protein 6 [Drosophila innubila]|uniref:golgin subfamily A member 6-like protein 6 n=1 Tax=Drosophila innubila TaxID=198719 RepID=UPI00148CB494|nr:golgin subfamily A member 6-like protein 6 [Drosophila innubila]